MKISDIGERELVWRIRSFCANGPEGTIVAGIGDDCAAYLPSAGCLQVVTIDALVEKTHFHFDYFPHRLLGRKAISVNVSDVAAMGGIPRYALVSLQLPNDFRLADVDSLYQGMVEAASAHKLSIVGGNLTSSELFSIHIAMIGEVAEDRMVSRGGSREGDVIYITGTIGEASAGLEIVSSKKTSGEYSFLREAYLNPSAKGREGRLLADNYIPSAMIDLSDGLASDLRQITVSSGVGALIEEGLLPASEDLRKYASASGKNILDYQLYGGEDYQLLFTVPAAKEGELKRMIKGGLVEAAKIGTIVGGEGISLLLKTGERQTIPDGGFSHF